jgi:DNA-binding NtrC family response regulator
VSSLRINDIYITPGAQIALGGTRLKFEPLGESVEIELADTDRFGSMIGRSVKMREMFARLEKLARTDTTVLVTGETGAGKELVAEALHDHSTRGQKDAPFVVLDCGSIPPNLIESELFGHERGAFTGATSSYAGAFERAHGGTVFLDEIGELPLAMQPKLLRVLERKEVRRVGGAKTIEVDVRIVAATNRDLGVEVNRGRFREDLYYRLAVARVHVPPLRERKDDLPLLIEHILATTPGGETASIAQETIDLMMKHDWPGNVRELRNVIERAVLLAESPEHEDALRRAPAPAPRSEPSITVTPSQTATSADASMTVPVDVGIPFKLAKQNVISEFERRYISRLLAQHDGNISAAARAAGIDRMSIHKMLHRLGLANPGRD